MLNFLFLRKKEVPAELLITEKVFESKFRAIEENTDPNKFMLAEKKMNPYYIYISSNDLKNLNNSHICFIDLQEFFQLSSKRLQFPEDLQTQISIGHLTELISKFTGWPKIKEFFTFESSSINDINKAEEFTNHNQLNSNEIKIIKINSVGRTVALINKHNRLIVTNFEDTKAYNLRALSKLNYSSDLHSNSFVDFEWHPINSNNFAIISKERVSLFKINKDLDCFHEQSLSIDNIIKFKWSPSAEYSIVISRNGHKFHLLDSNFKISYSKYSLSFLSGYVNVTWAADSSFFILYTKSSIYLYNTLNLSFKSWCDFRGNINNVIVSENSNYILIFTDDESNPMFVLYNIEEDFYNYSNYNSYNNISRYFLQQNYQVSNRNFCFFYAEDKQIVKSRLNLSNDRLVILYKDLKSSKYELKIFALDFSNSIHEININPICTLSNLRDFEVKDFELYFNYYQNEDVLLVLWDDQYLSKTYLNANELKIN